MQDYKITAVMMVAAISAALMGAVHLAAFAQFAESDVQSSSGSSGGGQGLSELLFDTGDAQNSWTSLTNNSPDNSDSASVAGTNSPEQTQGEQIATVGEEAEDPMGTELLPLIEDLFVDIDAQDSIGTELLPLIEELLGSFVD
jgi:hypothetical protein